ncbi:MAG: pyridoxal-phosphate dependent enzyme [Saprospiraceae bacterium]|jgi:cystathionine beta-synthase|uniref:pyridoxal-phosphate dependent enzyme n=1 Tax=Candidatus Brachybacter algidus TaxID=2982024 RepID=UPI001B3E3B56|nr:pyridoxal-phosphate dependent enzyme [Candidatus Brachybacter algidus]MBP7305447.1 pyridoxal-phosphate dependent enzyme [Saprospiraceae bacterium]MBK6372807.1 pyridoxal-phosphate dependent enzyme [Candidatus Brachybacter algidus]MBK6448224.1 pyridoxal-phosphate dependent enzyme [Candidatus Brachybacter algidus]MBK7603038.1 pyridoxal-phosphate dependent enzyme [Candidatus Brachybacter algidus]MBK8354288.1 pyridoxal-phosphate dependent enzyme [Candidatus Brachybacter algidus]
MYYNNILETIGNTPMVKLNKVVEGLPCLVLAKVETFNPGHSIKDRMALKMVQVAEETGKLKPGGTIIECTSGNTGMGLALVASIKGYKSIFTTSDKQSKEKMDMLKAVGAEVIICPTNVEPSDPRSYYSVAERLSKEIPNSYWFNQYDNMANSLAHYESTGPEIWEQTDGLITKLVVGVGTGGTISGTAKYLKEKNPNIEIIGIDTYGSVFKKYKETGIFDEKEIYPYITEGIGEDILPKNVDFSLIDHFEKVTDKDGALAARRLAREEGMLLGYSAGSALAGLLQIKDRLKPEDVVVIIFHDHGSRYVAKIYNDDWMRDRGFISQDLTLADLIRKKNNPSLISAQAESKLRDVFDLMKENDISQMVVNSNGQIVGSVTESDILSSLLENSENIDNVLVKDVMHEPFPIVDESLSVKELTKYISKKIPAVLVMDGTGHKHILTQYDIIQHLC